MRRLGRDVDSLACVKNLSSRLAKHSMYEPNTGCLLWLGSLATGGYGQIRLGRETWAAHRIAYFLEFGSFDRSLCVCHRCDVTICINPEHLFLGTDADNNADKIRKGRDKSPHGESVYRSKLKEGDIVEIFRLRQRGLTHQEIGRHFGVHRFTIAGVLHRRNWKHVEV